jgi:hypothetical protein
VAKPGQRVASDHILAIFSKFFVIFFAKILENLAIFGQLAGQWPLLFSKVASRISFIYAGLRGVWPDGRVFY